MSTSTAELTETLPDSTEAESSHLKSDQTAQDADLAEQTGVSRWFYGWTMVPLATLLMIATSPGQTFGITYFNAKFLTELNLSQTGLSTTYLAATVLASLAVPSIGGIVDRFGLRMTVLCGIACMAGACVFASQINGIVTLFLAFVLLRMIGPGTMSLCATNTLAVWFDRRLGLASSVMHISMAGAWALVPIVIVMLIDTFGWRGAYLAFAVMLVGGLLPLMALVYRQSPSDVGQHPDGINPQADLPKNKHQAGLNSGHELNVRQAMQHRAYWILMAATAMWALVGTGLVFHLVTLFQASGWARNDTTKAIACMAIAMGITQLVGGFLADRLASRWLLMVSMSLLATACSMLAWGHGLAIMVASYGVFGCSQGLMSIISNTAWARFFGRTHLGKIRGSSLTAAIGASAIGPLFMGVSVDYLSGYMPSLMLFAVMAGIIAFAGWWATPPVAESHDSALA